MLKNKLVIAATVVSIALLYYCYNKLALSVPEDAFVETEETVYLGKEHNYANLNLGLRKDAYLVQIEYPGKSQEKEFFINGLKIRPADSKLIGSSEVDYVNLRPGMLKDSQNVFLVRFIRGSPESFLIRIKNYYKAGKYLYILPGDSVYLAGGKGVGVYGYKIAINKALFWLVILYMFPVGFLLCYFINREAINARYEQLLSVSCKKYKIQYIGTIIFCGFVLAVWFSLVRSIRLGFVYPNNTFLFLPSDRFFDFFNLYDICKDHNPYFTTFHIRGNYYPFSNVLTFLSALLPKKESLVLLIVIFVSFFLYINISNLNTKEMNRAESVKYIFIFTFLSYPFLLCVDRMNNENILFIFLYLFVYSYSKKKFLMSSLFLSFAIAMKAFPAVFLVFLLSEKKYRETTATIALTVFLTAFSLIFHKGGFLLNLNYILAGFNYNNVLYLCQNNNMIQWGASLFTLSKMYFIQTNQIASIDLVKFLGIYTKVVFSLFILLSGYVLFIEKELWKKVMILVAVALLFPHASSEAKLIYIFIPLFLFINSSEKSKFDLFYMVMFGLFLIPKKYYFFSKIVSDSCYNDVSIGIILNILILIAMVVAIIIEGVSNRPSSRRVGVI